MNAQMIWELVGYAASALILTAMAMTSIVKLRVINTLGSFIFAIYALFGIHSYPTALVNFSIVVVQIYQLSRLHQTEKYVTLVPIDSINTNDRYLKKFLAFYRNDIQKYFPDFAHEKNEADYGCYVCFDMETVGLFFGKKRENDVLEVYLDYTTPKYRDGSVGKALYPILLIDEGFSKLVVHNPGEEQAKYLLSAGFSKDKDTYVMQ